MACFSSAYSPSNYNSNVTGCTDAGSYTASATSIDFRMAAKVAAGRYDYTLALEVWNAPGDYWEAVELKSGYFSSNVTKVFYLAGRRQGSYRLHAYLTNNGKHYQNITPAFAVYR